MQATTPSQKVRIGLFTIVGILLLAAGIFFIGKSKSLFTDTYRVNGTFSNVGGLQPGNNVRFAGITAGAEEKTGYYAGIIVSLPFLASSPVLSVLTRFSGIGFLLVRMRHLRAMGLFV